MSTSPSSLLRRRILDAMRARVVRWPQAQALALMATALGMLLAPWWAPAIAYALFQVAESVGLMVARRVFFAARNPHDDLSQFQTSAILSELGWSLAIVVGMSLCLLQAKPEAHTAVLALWCLTSIVVALQGRYFPYILGISVLVQVTAMCLVGVAQHLTAPDLPDTLVIHLGLAALTAACMWLAGMRLSASYSEQLEREQALVASIEAQRKMIQKRTELLGRLSHEMRTPMNGIMGLTSLLQRTPLTDEQRRQLELLRASGEHMMCLLEDSLDLAQLEAQGVTLALAPVDLASLLEEQERLFRPVAREKGLALSFEIVGDVPSLIELDATRLRQCVGNLLNNAIKFSEAGAIDLRLHVDTARRPADIEITVADRGIGVPPELAVAIFDPYAQARSSAVRHVRGAGLGLAITRRLVRLMDGDVTYQPRDGGGSIFSLRFRGTVRAVSWLPEETPIRQAG